MGSALVPAHFEQPEPPPEVLSPETVLERLAGFELQTAEGRAAFRASLVKLKAEALIDARDLEAFLRAARDQENDKAANANQGTKRVVFGLITNRSDAQDYSAAQELREEMS